MATEPTRSRPARQAAEEAPVRVVHHYGDTPEFVVLGGLVPELLCDNSGKMHAGTTDVDVQVDLEIAAGAKNAARLEQALKNAEFESTDGRTWRWETRADESNAIVKFELLTDLEDYPASATVNFAECDALGAVNLRGTRFASRDFIRHPLSSKVGGVYYNVEVNVTGVAGFLMAKSAAAYSRRKEKDWYDIAFVLLHGNDGGPRDAAERTKAIFSGDLVGETRTALDELLSNFTRESDQGPSAYASQFSIDHPQEDDNQLRSDAVLAVSEYHDALFAI